MEVDQVVLVSRKGFTQPAIQKARLVGISLLTIREAEELDWPSFVERSAFAKFQTINVERGLHICGIRFTPPLDAALETVAASEGRLLCGHGRDHGSPLEFARSAVEQQVLPANPSLPKDLLERSRKNPADGYVVATRALPGYKIALRGKEYPVQEIQVRLHATSQSAPLTCTPYIVKEEGGGTRVVQHFEADLGDRVMELLLPEGLQSKKW